MAIDPARAEAVFNAAVGQPLSERPGYIRGACREEPELEARVNALLQAHDGLGSFLEPPARESPSPGAMQEVPGIRIGRYKLLQLIGEGGGLKSQERGEDVNVLPDPLLKRRDLGGGRFDFRPSAQHL